MSECKVEECIEDIYDKYNKDSKYCQFHYAKWYMKQDDVYYGFLFIFGIIIFAIIIVILGFLL